MIPRNRLFDQYGRPMESSSGRPTQAVSMHTLATPKVNGNGRTVQASYDAAQTTSANKYYWPGSDATDADRSNNPQVRKTTRERARYVVANDPLARGIVLTKANHEVGPTGPRLQVTETKRSKQIEDRWNEWAEEIGFAPKLHTTVQARITDGEGFGQKRTNPTLSCPVKLDWHLFECDQCYTPWMPFLMPNRCDGVWYDDWGRPTFFDILRWHPGGVYPLPSLLYDTLPAQFFTHCFRADRPNQHRGVSEISPSLGLFAQRKQYLNAVIRAAQNSAKMSAFIKTEAPSPEYVTDPAEIGAAEMPDGMVAALPYGYSIDFPHPAYPPTTLDMFERILVARIARALNMPYNIAACDSSQYNFSSGRLDHQTYFAGVRVDQCRNQRQICDPLFADWFREANSVYGWGYAPGTIPAHVWHWVEPEYSDPEAEANALKTLLSVGLANHQQVLTRQGLEVEAVFAKAAETLGFEDIDEYRLWIRSNLAAAKGGTQPGGVTEDRMAQAIFAQALGERVKGKRRGGRVRRAMRAFFTTLANAV